MRNSAIGEALSRKSRLRARYETSSNYLEYILFHSCSIPFNIVPTIFLSNYSHSNHLVDNNLISLTIDAWGMKLRVGSRSNSSTTKTTRQKCNRFYDKSGVYPGNRSNRKSSRTYTRYCKVLSHENIKTDNLNECDKTLRRIQYNKTLRRVFPGKRLRSNQSFHSRSLFNFPTIRAIRFRELSSPETARRRYNRLQRQPLRNRHREPVQLLINAVFQQSFPVTNLTSGDGSKRRLNSATVALGNLIVDPTDNRDTLVSVGCQQVFVLFNLGVDTVSSRIAGPSMMDHHSPNK